MSNPDASPPQFLKISSLLTGFTETELIGTGMLDSYLNTILKNSAKEDVKYFFENAKEILDEPNQTEESIAISTRKQLMPDSSYGGLAKKIIILWYTGSWKVNENSSKIISPASYKQGLMWDAGHTHPPGAKQPGFGSWAKLPISVMINDKSKTNGN
ncbi:hypothetical protein [Algoriphagus sp.]|uniref:hypothetical protein n=1 Tax=Algoriphagus sp. TaxID=1872435 RepID=UPI0025DE1F20|nr:hypothetical protein [Algoriphagus sp.]